MGEIPQEQFTNSALLNFNQEGSRLLPWLDWDIKEESRFPDSAMQYG